MDKHADITHMKNGPEAASLEESKFKDQQDNSQLLESLQSHDVSIFDK